MEKVFLHFIVLWMLLNLSQITGIEESHDRRVPSSSNDTVNKPEIVSWEIDNHYLIVNWQHSDPNQRLHGYYLALCQSADTRPCKGPDFVNFDRGSRSGRVVGLAPEAMYRVEVIAYAADVHVSSEPVIVNTKKLQFLLARNLSVSLVTCCHAVFQWKHEPLNNVHDVRFLLQCTGRREYVDSHQKIVEEEHRFEHSNPSTSKEAQIYLAKNLDPHTKYLCTISSTAGTIQSPPSQQISFKTRPGKPSIPPTPKISITKDNVFTASLLPTNERFGPISHYMLIAVPVSKSTNDPLTAPYQPIVPLNHLLEKALSSKTVTTVSQPLPFIVSTFAPDQLPVNFNFGYEWNAVFKQKTYYSVVLVAFTRTMNNNLFHSLSALSNPVFITEDLVQSWIKKQKPVAKKFTVIIVSCIFAVVILFTIAFLILFISNYCYAKRKDARAYKFAISDTDSSEEEIFTKGKLAVKEKLLGNRPRPMSSKAAETLESRSFQQEAGLSQRSPTTTHAEWAMENMSRRSPAFREMIKKHPETLDEMSDVMAKVGQKWELEMVTSREQLTHKFNLKAKSQENMTKQPKKALEQSYSRKIRSAHRRQSSSSSDSSFSEPIYSNDPRTFPPPVPPRIQSSGQEYAHQHSHGQEYVHQHSHRGNVQGSHEHYGYPQEYSQQYAQDYSQRGHVHAAHTSHQGHRQNHLHQGLQHSYSHQFSYQNADYYDGSRSDEGSLSISEDSGSESEDSFSEVDLT